MKNIKYTQLLLLALLIWSCDDESEVATIDELTVEAYLHAGQPLDSVKFAKVIPLDSLEALSVPVDLIPIITDTEGAEYELFYSGEAGIYTNPDLIIEEGQIYTIEVGYNEKTVFAETFIPEAPTALELSDTLIKRAKIDDITDIFDQEIPEPIEVNWEGEADAFYFVNVANIEEDPELINTFIDEEDLPERPNILTEPSTQTSYAVNTFADITHYGTYEVTVFRVNPEYVTLYEDNTSGSGALNEIRTNVQNGFGIFTGINSATIYFEVTQ